MSPVDGNRPEGWPAELPWVPMSAEGLEQLLLGIRNAASGLAMAELIHESKADRPTGAIHIDATEVWHATEIALAMIHDGYVPKREAVADLLARVERFTAG